VARVTLSLALSGYAHTQDLVSGRVLADGIDLVCTERPVEEIFHRFVRHREWDVSEMSLAKYCSLVSQSDDTLTAIPVFPSRVFRHSAIYVRADGPVRAAADLAGRRVGIPEWTQTAGVYVRGFLQHQFGVPLSSVDWYQAGVDEPGREEHVPPALPDGIRLTPVADRSLDDLLRTGDIDAVITARAPRGFVQGLPHVARLFPDFRRRELLSFRETGIHPIMHVLALRADAFAGRRWMIGNLLQAFLEAKARTLAKIRDGSTSYLPLPWGTAEAGEAVSMLGEDFFPYGIEANRPTLSAFLSYAEEQGILRRSLSVEELFAPEVHSRYRV